MAGGFTFDNIFLLGRGWGNINRGQLSFVQKGLEWRKQGRDVIDVKVRYAHILNITWMKLSNSNQLVLLIKDGCKIKFIGFSNQNMASLNSFFENVCKIARINNADVQIGGEQSVVAYKSIQTLPSCGSFTLELYLSFLRIYCSVDIFKIQSSKIARVFVLPKSKVHTFVVITFHPFTKNGKTMQSHIVIKFYSGDRVESTLVMNRDLYATKYKDKLEPGYKGPIHEVFAKILCGLSGTNLIIPGKFRGVQNEYAVKSSLKSGNGVLYPLEKSFLFVPTPATLIDHDEIECVKFEMRSAIRSSTRFDLIVSLKTKQEHLFRNIEKSEFRKLLHYIRSKRITIKNLEDATQAPFGVAAVLQAEEDDAVDPHLERIMNAAGNEESDAEVEDFVTDKDDDGSSTDDSDGSDSGSEKERVRKKESMKKPTASK